MRIEVHSKAGCPWCERAKEWLAARGHAFVEVRHDDAVERNAFYDSLGLVGAERTVPQVLAVEGEERLRIGGYDKLEGSGL